MTDQKETEQPTNKSIEEIVQESNAAVEQAGRGETPHVQTLDDAAFVSEEVKESKEQVESEILTDDEESVKEPDLPKPLHFDVPEDHVLEVGGEKHPEIKERVLPKNMDNDEILFTVRGTARTVVANLIKAGDGIFDIKDRQKQLVEVWDPAIQRALSLNMLENDQLLDVVVRENSTWVNLINAGTESQPKWVGPVNDLTGRNPNDKNDVTSLAKTLFTRTMGLGTPVYAPLYHTGIWVQLQVPKGLSFAQLDEIIANEKQIYGRQTRGVIYTNSSIVTRKHVADFLLDHVIFTNAPSSDPDYLRSIIKAPDLDELMRAIMQARYPDGYPFKQVCTADPTKCSHVVEGDIDLRKISWVDRKRLTDRQITIMSNPRRRLTEDDLRTYQEDFLDRSITRVIMSPEGTKIYQEDDEIINGVVLTIETPTLEKEEEYGLTWVREIERSMEEAFREKHDTKAREARQEQILYTAQFKMYGQWVKQIDIYSGGQVVKAVTDAVELNDLFEYFSSDARYVDMFKKTIDKHIANYIVQLVAIKNYECPKCGKKQDTSPGDHYILLPIDTLSTFFTLVRSTAKKTFLLTDS